MRKLLLSVACLAFMAGVIAAAEHDFVSYDKEKKVLTVKDKDGKEVTGKLSDKTKVTYTDKNGDKKEGKIEDVEKRWGGDKAPKTVDVTIEKGEVTEITVKGGKKGKKTNN